MWVSVREALNDHARLLEREQYDWFDYVEDSATKAHFQNKVERRVWQAQRAKLPDRRMLKTPEGRVYLAECIQRELGDLYRLSETMTLDELRPEIPNLCAVCTEEELQDYFSKVSNYVSGESPASLTEEIIAKKARMSKSKFQKERAAVRRDRDP